MLAAFSLLSVLAMPLDPTRSASLSATRAESSDGEMAEFLASVKPAFTMNGTTVGEEGIITKGSCGWSMDPHKYEHSMTMFAYATLNGKEVSNKATLGAFVEGSAKGEMVGLSSIMPRKFPFGKYANKNMFGAMVYGPVTTCTSCSYTYKLCDEGTVYPVKSINKAAGDPTKFKANAHYGHLIMGAVEFAF